MEQQSTTLTKSCCGCDENRSCQPGLARETNVGLHPEQRIDASVQQPTPGQGIDWANRWLGGF